MTLLPAAIDPVVHAPVRLAVLTQLTAAGTRDFSTLKQSLNVSDGALGMHLQRLVSAGYIKCQKAHYDGKPRSTYLLSHAGRRALESYARCMAELLGDRLEEIAAA